MRRVINLRRPRTQHSQFSSQHQMERVSNHYKGQLTTLSILVKNRGFWRPPVDVCETQAVFLVKVELSGMYEAVIDIILGADHLRISGQRPERRDDQLQYYHQMDINYGSFDFEISLPLPIDYDRVFAYYDDGFLFVELPKISEDVQHTKLMIPINQS
ncbi:MAG: hypothetical protein GFH27_549293n119 [Chloroflexi bacterium AL-W]|nr:hypothetical protein [Chloroflexi bacterium AL-N1]NOK67766.1 hypothetical protein [Chloroflexi bacterium AL-N10]NOK75464.1 hypothetical protein [Chloroflexi bacterium AL-N5]NOK82252.1 hypothetical protein [Chloroflexi bacterium AL-W]NOK90097.1 hypothetical protein [Chloroflexi bacterium AL-N15]